MIFYDLLDDSVAVIKSALNDPDSEILGAEWERCARAVVKNWEKLKNENTENPA